MVAKENEPLAAIGYFRRLVKDFDDRLAVFQLYGHEHSGHEGKVKRRVEFVAVTKIGADIRWPLVCLGQQHRSRIGQVQTSAKFADDGVRFGQVFAQSAFPFDKIGNRVQPEAVYAEMQPELHHLPYGLENGRVVEIQIRLMTEKSVPVIGLRNGVPGPVGGLRIDKNDGHTRIASIRLAPYVPVSLGVFAGASRLLKPGVLVRRMIRPMRVTRGSFSVACVNWTPSSNETIDRNLSTRIVSLLNP